MDKKLAMLGSLFVILVLLSYYFVSYGLMTGDFTIQRPTNGTFNSSTNNTQPFVFKYLNNTVAFANCSMYLDNMYVANNISTKNNTNTTFYSNASFSDGFHQWYVYCYNASSTPTNMTSAITDLIIDTTAPYQLNILYPQDSLNTSNATILFALSALDNVGDYYSSGKTINLTLNISGAFNKTAYGNNGTYIYFTEVFPDGLYYWNFSAKDNASNSLRSSTQSFRVDTTAPSNVAGSYTFLNNTGTSSTSGNMTYTLNFTVTDAQLPISSAWGKIHQNGTITTVYPTRTTNDTGTISAWNYLTITSGNIPQDGNFTFEPWFNDTLNNAGAGTNQTNLTKVSLYPGWNLIQVMHNMSLINISNNLSNEIIQVSWWNNSAMAYVNFVAGSTTNSGVTVQDGDAVYVYSKANIALLRKWSVDSDNLYNMSLKAGWNQVAFFNTTMQLYQTCKHSISNASASIIAVSYYDARLSTYKSQICSITAGWNNNVTVERGKGIWLNVNTTTGLPLRRVA